MAIIPIEELISSGQAQPDIIPIDDLLSDEDIVSIDELINPKPTLGEAVQTIAQPENSIPLGKFVFDFATGETPEDSTLKKIGRHAARLGVGPATALDVISTPFKAIRPALGPIFGLDKGTTFPERLEKGFEDPLNFSLASGAAGAAADTAGPELDKATLSGDQSAIDKAKQAAFSRAFLAGTATDVAEGLGIASLFKGLGNIGKTGATTSKLPDDEIAQVLQQSLAKPKTQGLPKSALPKAEKQAIVARAKATEQAKDAVRLEKTLAKTKEQAVGRGKLKDVPFTPKDKNLGKAAKASLKQAKKAPPLKAIPEGNALQQGIEKAALKKLPKKTGVVPTPIEKQGRIKIPDFKNTNEAIAFGTKHKGDKNIVKALQKKRADLQAQAKRTTDEAEEFLLIQKAQFPREAIEATGIDRVLPSTPKIKAVKKPPKLSEKQLKKRNPKVKQLREVRKTALLKERAKKQAKLQELSAAEKKKRRLELIKQKGRKRDAAKKRGALSDDEFKAQLRIKDKEIEAIKKKKDPVKLNKAELERDLFIADFIDKRHGGGFKFGKALGDDVGAIGDVGPLKRQRAAESLKRTLEKHYPGLIEEAERTGKPVSRLLSEKTNLASAEVERLAQQIDELMKIAKKTGKIGNIQLSKFSKEVQDAIKKSPEDLPEISSKKIIQREKRLRSVGKGEVDDLAKEILARSDEDLAAVADHQVVLMKKLVDVQKKTGKDQAPAIAQAVRSYQRLRSGAGRILEASKKPPDIDEVRFVLTEALRKGKVSGEEATQLKGAIEILDELPKASRRAPNLLDQMLELTSSNMLSSTDTMMRNFLGNAQLIGLKTINKATTEVLTAGAQGINRALGLVSGRRVSIPVANRAAVGETFIETSSILKNLPRATKNAFRFLINESEGDVLVALQHQYKDISLTPLIKIHKNPKVARAIKIKMLRELRDDVGRILERQGVNKIEDFTTRTKSIPDISDPFERLLPKWAHKYVKPETLKKSLPLKFDVRNKQGDIITSIKFGGSTVRLVFRPLKAGDEFFGLLAEQGTRDALRWRKLLRSGKKIPLNAKKFRAKFEKIPLTEAELDDALEARLYYTLLKDFDTKEAKAFFKWMNNTNLGKTSKFLFRFIRTLTNLSKIAWHHSPLGITTVIRESVKAKAIDLNSVSRVINGTVAGHLLYGYIKQNPNVEIRGAAITHSQRKQWEKEDFPEQSLRVKEKDDSKTVFQFANNAPATFMLSALAVMDAKDERTALGMPATQNANRALLEAGKAFLSESYLDTPQQLVQLVTDMSAGKPLINQDDPEESLLYSEAFGRWFGRFVASQTVPNIIRKVTKTGIGDVIPADATKRKPRNIREEFKAAIPFISKEVPADLFWDGTPIPRKGEKFFNPVKVRKDQGSKLDKALSQLQIYPSPPRRTSRGLPLSPKERREMIVKYGPKLREAMEKIVNHRKWDQLTEVQQQKVLKTIIRTANSVGYLETATKALKRLRQTDEGRSAVEFFRFKGLKR